MNKSSIVKLIVASVFVLLVSERAPAAVLNSYVYDIPEDDFTVKFGEGGDVGGTSDNGWADDKPYTFYYNNMELWSPDDMRSTTSGVDGWTVLAFKAPAGYYFETFTLNNYLYLGQTDNAYSISTWWDTTYTGAADPNTSSFDLIRTDSNAGKYTRTTTVGSEQDPIGGTTLFVATRIQRPGGSSQSSVQGLSENFTFTFTQIPEPSSAILFLLGAIPLLPRLRKIFGTV